MEMSFTDRLVYEMRDQGVSQARLARMIGQGKSSIYDYCHGRVPQPRSIIAICQALNLNKIDMMKLAIVQRGGKDAKLVKEFDKNKATFAELCRYDRLLKGLTIQEMAVLGGVSDVTVNRWEYGTGLPEKDFMPLCLRMYSYDDKVIGKAIERDAKRLQADAYANGSNIKYLSTYTKVTKDDYSNIDTSSMSIYSFMQKRRAELDISIKELAEVTGISVSTMRAWTGERVMRPYRLPYVADVLKVDIMELLKMFIAEYNEYDVKDTGFCLLRFCICSILGLSRARFCEAIGLDNANLSRYEHRVRRISDKYLNALSDTFGFEPDFIEYLLAIDGKMENIEEHIIPAARYVLQSNGRLKGMLPLSVVNRIMED